MKVYRNVLLNNPTKHHLVGKIKGLSSESISVRKKFLKIKSKKKYIKYSLLSTRLSIGYDVRHHLLAYAFMRGVPYSALEKTCREDNRPNSKTIYNIVIQHLPTYYHPQWTEDRICKWLKGERV